jgi:hypothetical protein
MSFPRRAGSWGACLFPAFAASAWSADQILLKCPEGTALRVHVSKKDGLRSEVCFDPRTKLKEGPTRLLRDDGSVAAEWPYRHSKMHGEARSYTEKGELEYVIEFRDGEEITRRLTLAGLRNVIDMSNADRNGRHPGEATVIDERTVRFTFTILDPLPADPFPDRDEIERKLVESGDMCGMFTIPGAQIETVVVRSVSEAGDLLMEMKLSPDQCKAK